MPASALTVGDPPTRQIRLPLAPEAASYDLVRDSRGMLYVASEGEVLAFDGQRWERVPVPGTQLVRSLALGPNDRIYVGGYHRLGFIARDPYGALAYQEWSAQLPSEWRDHFEDIWQTRSDAAFVYFRALNQLFRFDHSGRFDRVWESPGRFGAIEYIDDELWVQWRGLGLQRLVDDEFQMVWGGEQFADTLVYTLWSHPQGGQITVSQRPDLQWLRDGRVDPIALLPTGMAPSTLTKHGILASGLAVAGTQDGRVVEFDLEHARTSVSTVSNDYISGIAADPGGDLWTVDDEVLTSVQLESPWRVLDAGDGLRGSQAELLEVGDDWYALSSAGVYRATQMSRGNPRFERVDVPIGEAWSIVSQGSDLLIAESYAIWRLRAGAPPQALTNNKLYPRLLLAAQAMPGRFYVGTEAGVSVLDLSADAAQVTSAADLQARVDTLVEIAPGRVLVGTQSAGVHELTVDGDGHGVAHALGAEVGLRYGAEGLASVFRLQDSVRVATEVGLFRWDSERFIDDDLGGLQTLLPAGSVPLVVADGEARYWALSGGQAWLYADGSWRALEPPPGENPSLRNLYVVGAGQAVFGATSRLLTYDPRRAPTPPRRAVVEWRRAWLESQGRRSLLPVVSGDLGVLPARSSLRIQFAAPGLSAAPALQYRQRVVGIDRGWSSWSPVAEASLGALPSGRMHLEVQARSGVGTPGPVRSLNWEIAPLWHERAPLRALMIATLVLLGGLGAWAAGRWRLKRLRLRNERLEEMVHARTEALELANVQLRAQTLRDGLTGIANRRAFDIALREAGRHAVLERSWLALLMIDADHFKAYNDSHGHLQGDELLRALAAEIARDDRADRFSARWGGEEFAVLMAATDLAGAEREAERVRARIGKSALGVSVSVGAAACIPASAADVDLLLAAADGALYAAKAAGRDRIVLADAVIATPPG
jgi:diguanylate cyclase (GGDEF)-like protein